MILIYRKNLKEQAKDPYFKSYESIHIHEKMIKDKARTSTYKEAFMRNPKLFKNAVVLDVGCGTGILSIFAAQAGAKHVYSVERSDTADVAMNIIEENGLSHKITVIKKEMEKVTMKDIPLKVDIIISEWMGFCLLYEGMLDSVIWARDNFLKEGGKMFPELA